MNMKIHTGVAGRYKMAAVSAETGERRQLTGWFDNLVVNNGLDEMAANSTWLNCCQVGTGATAAAATDTALQTYVAGTSTVLSSTIGEAGTYYHWRQKVYQFALGAAEGNISEVGIASATTGNVFSRALVVDGGGSPTTVTVLSMEYLEVTYEIRFYVASADVPHTLTIESVGRTGTLRAAYADQPGYGRNIGNIITLSSNAMTFYTGAIGSITGFPSGTLMVSSIGTVDLDAYSGGTYQRVATWYIGTTQANHASGIGAVRFTTPFGAFQVDFSPVLDKDATKDMYFSLTLTWGRYTP